MSKRPSHRKHFTEDNVLRLPARRKQYLIWDEVSGKGGSDAARGLAILISPSGTKSYRAVYYYPGSSKPHWMSLGRVGEITLERARERCREVRGKARDGLDPTEGAAIHSDHFKDAVEYYTKHEKIGRARTKSAMESQAVILNHCKDWHSKPIATLRYREIENLLAVIRDGDKDKDVDPRPYLANRLFAHLKDFFSWAVRSQRIPVSPMSEMQRPWEGESRRERDWFKGDKADDCLRGIWAAADKIGGNEGRYIKVMSLVGKRRTALAGMRWEHIDTDWYWHAPPSDSPNKKLNGVPLAKFTQRILSPRKKEGLVFGHINLDGVARRARKYDGVPDDFFLHGFRHILETKAAELGILPHVADLLFDHTPLTFKRSTSRGAGSVYDHHHYRDVMQDGAESIADYIERLTTAKGVRRVK